MRNYIGKAFLVKSMRKKLFLYMILLALLVLLTFLSGLFLIGSLDNVSKKTYRQMKSMMDMYERQIMRHFDSTAVMGRELSDDFSVIIDKYLYDNGINFKEVNDSQEHIYGLEEALFDTLKQKMVQTQCSGAFVVLNASAGANTQIGKSGLYMHWEGYGYVEDNILLFRGNTMISRQREVMTHRKWRLEFQDELLELSNTFPVGGGMSAPSESEMFSRNYDDGWMLTDVMDLPETSDRIVLLIREVKGSDGTVYGICGYEISENFFKHSYAQPASFNSMTCYLFPKTGQGDELDLTDALSAGTTDGYYYAPGVKVSVGKAAGGLWSFAGESISTIGISREVLLSGIGQKSSLHIMISKDEYDREVFRRNVRILLLIIFLAFFSVASCFIFSRRYVIPLLRSIEGIKNGEINGGVGLEEIDDLFAFLAEKDRLRREEYDREMSSLRQEIRRLAYNRKKEIDPDCYQNFLDGIDTLTKTEKKIFDLYCDGYSAGEIMDIANIKESTLRYHNQNIYSKLSVKSMKVMLRYCSLMRNDRSRNKKD